MRLISGAVAAFVLAALMLGLLRGVLYIRGRSIAASASPALFTYAVLLHAAVVLVFSYVASGHDVHALMKLAGR